MENLFEKEEWVVELFSLDWEGFVASRNAFEI
jgi:hypothetical protein